MKRNILLFTLTGILFLLLACAGTTPTITITPTAIQYPSREIHLWVGPKQVDCQGGPQGKCLQAKYSATDTDWVNFGEVIQGFEWDEGYDYELLIKVTDIRPENSDITFRSFELIKIVSKTPVK